MAKINLTPCRFANHTRDVLCGSYAVFEDRAALSGRKIDLNIVVLPALAAKPAGDPVFYLAGGPGQGAATVASSAGDGFMQEIRRERDVVFVDQRGTGRSHGLLCAFMGDQTRVQSYFDDIFALDQVRACRKELEPIADLTLYTTPIAMADIDEVRQAMGYEKIHLYGASYGTLSALEYLRHYPQHVRSMVLAGVAAPAAKLPLQFARGAQSAMSRLLEDCAAEETCRAAFPSLQAEFAAVLAQLEKGPVAFEIPHPKSKESQPATMSRGVFAEALRLILYSRSGSARVPLLIHLAAEGDWTPFGTAALPALQAAVYARSGAYLTITCAESVPTITEEDIARETRDTFLGDYRTRRHQQACHEWPRTKVSADYYEPVVSDIPVLMFSTEFDPATPPDFGRAAAQSLPNGRQLIVRDRTHDYGSVCLATVAAKFIANASTHGLDTACIDGLRPADFATELPPQLGR